MKTLIRSASHANSWYSGSKSRLSNDLENWLKDAHGQAPQESEDGHHHWKSVSINPTPLKDCRAIIAPHAGYAYSGRTAAWAYKLIDPTTIKTVFVLGPSHHFYLNGCALSICTEYETPLGNLPIDTSVNEKLLNETNMFDQMDLQTDEDEHSIELHLPYIRHVFKNQDIKIVPILVGSISAQQEKEYGAILAPYLADPENFFVVSSDFCHWGTRFSYTYYQDATSGEPAKKLSSSCSPKYPIYKSIEDLDKKAIDAISIDEPLLAHQSFEAYLKQTKNTVCGRHPIGVLLGCMSKLQESVDQPLALSFVRYDQSSRCQVGRDSSVSYASAYLTLSKSNHD